MRISGTNQDVLGAFIRIQNYGNSFRSKLDNESISGNLSYYTEADHVELSLTHETFSSLDYIYEAIAMKTNKEISAFEDYMYTGDYFSSENVAKRIIDYARSLWDGSEESFEILSKAIDTGIDEAKKILGEMPDWLGQIINKTTDLVHESLEMMKQEISRNQ